MTLGLLVFGLIIVFIIHKLYLEAETKQPAVKEMGCRNMMINATSANNSEHCWETDGCKIHQYSME